MISQTAYSQGYTPHDLTKQMMGSRWAPFTNIDGLVMKKKRLFLLN